MKKSKPNKFINYKRKSKISIKDRNRNRNRIQNWKKNWKKIEIKIKWKSL